MDISEGKKEKIREAKMREEIINLGRILHVRTCTSSDAPYGYTKGKFSICDDFIFILFAEFFLTPPKVTVFFFLATSGTRIPSAIKTSLGCTYL